MIRTKGEAGTGNVVEAVRHMRTVTNEMRALTQLEEAQLMSAPGITGPLSTWSGRLPPPASSRWSTSPPVASPRLRTRR